MKLAGALIYLEGRASDACFRRSRVNKWCPGTLIVYWDIGAETRWSRRAQASSTPQPAHLGVGKQHCCRGERLLQHMQSQNVLADCVWKWCREVEAAHTV